MAMVVSGYRQPASVLGNLQNTYGGRIPRRLLMLLWIATPLFAAGSVAITMLLLTDTDNAAAGDLAAAVVMDVLFGTLALALPIMAFVHRGKTVRMFEQGIEFANRGRVVSVRWDEIQRVFFTNVLVRVNGISTGAQATCTLEGDSFGRIRLTQWFDGVAPLGEEVQRAIHPRLREQAGAAWNRNEPLWFGPLSVAPDGLRLGSKHLPWESVEHVAIDGGSVTIRAKGKMLAWAMLQRAKVPNALVLREIVSRATVR